MPSQRLQSLHPRKSIRRLRTALAPLSPTTWAASTASSIASSSPSPPSTSTTFPRDYFPGLTFSSSTFFSGSDLSLSVGRTEDRNVIPHIKSSVEIELEDERWSVADELVALIEPRPSIAGQSLGGIEEILEGRV